MPPNGVILADRRYGEVYQEFHLDIEGWSAVEAGKHIRDSTVAPELAALLDDWAMLCRRINPEDEARWKHLLDVARAADPDGWRTQLRDALAGNDRDTLVSLASSDEAVKLLPGTLGAVGKRLVRTGAIKPAEDLLRKAQRQHPDDFWINQDLGLLLWDARPRRNDEAIAFLTAAVALRPQSPGAHVNLGNVLHEKRDVDGAIAEYHKAIDLDPKVAFAHYNLGVILIAKQDVDGAIAEYKRAIDSDPKFAQAHSNLGVALREKQDLEGAIVEFHKAIDLDPKHVQAHNNLGVALHDKQDLEGEITEYRAAIHIDSKYAPAHNNLGLALAARQDREGAIVEFHLALDINPKYANAHTNLGRILRDKGQFAEALTHFRRGQELGAKDSRSSDQSAQLVKECERLVELDSKSPAILMGKEKAADAAEQSEYAGVCQMKRLYATATRLHQEAFAAKPILVASPVNGLRYNAACAAALAGCGAGEDAAKPTDAELAGLRKQALDWLWADLDAWGVRLDKEPDKARPAVVQKMEQWLRDADFNGVRGPDALAKLPEAERKEWQKLWADVADTLAKAQEKLAPEQKPGVK